MSLNPPTDILMLASRMSPRVCAGRVEGARRAVQDAFALMEQRKVIGKACIIFGSGSKL